MNRRNVKLSGNKRVGLGNSIKTPNQLTQHLEKRHLKPASTQVKKIQKAFEGREQSYYVDIEFTHKFPCEICVMNSKKVVLVNTTINYGCTIAELYDTDGFSWMDIASLSKIYGPPTNEITPGLTPTEIMAVLKDHGMTQQSLLVEWSSNKCDYNWVLWLAKQAGQVDIVPRFENTFSPLSAWRSCLPGFFSFRLSDLYSFLYPDELKSRLSEVHRALFDTVMLYDCTQVLYDHTYGVKDKKG